MTVRLLDDVQKRTIAVCYTDGAGSETLAQFYGVSRRTIQRVLVEQGVARTPSKPDRVQVARFVVTPVTPEDVAGTPTPVTPTPAAPLQQRAENLSMAIEMLPEPSWLEKSIATIKRAVDKLFTRTNDQSTR